REEPDRARIGRSACRSRPCPPGVGDVEGVVVNEVRDLCERLLDTPAPPMRTADEVLTIARRARRRRNLLTTTGVAGLVLGLVLGIAVVLDRTGGDGQVFVAAPAARASAAHGARMSAVLIGAVPDGHTTGRVETFSDDPVVHPS